MIYPQSIETERAVLGCILIDNGCIPEIYDRITTEHFYDNKHAQIYEAIIELYQDGVSIDAVSLYSRIESKGYKDAASAAFSVAGCVSTAVNVSNYLNVLENKYLLRRVITAAQTIQAQAQTIEQQAEIDRVACERQREEQERLQADARRQQMELVAAIKPPDRAEGQSVRQDWDFEVVDIWQLARMHPACVEVKARRSEILGLLRTGHTLAGIRAFLVVKSTTRTAKRVEVEV